MAATPEEIIVKATLDAADALKGFDELIRQMEKKLRDVLPQLKAVTRETEKTVDRMKKPVEAAAKACSESAEKAKKSTSSIFAGIQESLKKFTPAKLVQNAFGALERGVKAGIGRLAEQNEAFGGAMRGLSDSITTLYGSIAAAAAPVIETLAPIFGAIVDAIADVADAAAACMAALFGKDSFFHAAGGAFAVQPIDPSVTSSLQGLRGALETVEEPLRRLGGAVWDGLSWGVEHVLKPLGAWTFSAAIPPLLGALADVFGLLRAALDAAAPLLATVWENALAPMAQWTGGIIVTVLEALAAALGKLGEWAAAHPNLFGALLTALGALMAAQGVTGVIGNIGATIKNTGGLIQSLKKGFESVGNIFTPLLTGFSPVTLAIAGVIAALVLLATHWDEAKVLFAQAADFLMGVWDSVAAFFGQLYEQHLKPFLDGLAEGFSTFFTGVLAPLMNSVITILTAFYTETLVPLFSYLFELLAVLWADHIQPLWDKLVEFCAALGEMLAAAGQLLSALWENVILPVLVLIGEKLLWLWNSILLPLLEFLGGVFSSVIDGVMRFIAVVFADWGAAIADVAGYVIDIFSGVIHFLTAVFSGDWAGAWNAVKEILSGVWDAICGIFTGAVNFMIDILNSLISGLVNVVNKVGDGLRTVFGNIQGIIDAASDKLAQVGIDVHFHMPQIERLSYTPIPRLATGSVLRSATLFLGGEYPGADTNPEVVSPLSTMKEAFRDAMAENGGPARPEAELLPLRLELDGEVFYRAMVKIKENRGARISSTFAECR